MYLKELKVRNIGRYGNNTKTIEFSEEGKLIHLRGRSGSGKTTILQLPNLLIYGKTPGVNKSDIANRIHGNGYILGTIQKGEDTYTIERKFKPNSLKIMKNGEDIQNIGITDGQSYIENEIVGMPFQIFTNVVSIDLNNFKSFIAMTPSEKKAIVDRIFNIGFINELYTEIKKDIKDVSTYINQNQAVIDQLENTISNAIKGLEDVKSVNTQQIQSRINELVSTNEALLKHKQDFEQKKLNADEIFKKLNVAIHSCNKDIAVCESDIRNVEAKIDLFRQSKCPTCSGELKGEYFDSIRTSLDNLLNELKVSLSNHHKTREGLAETERTFNENYKTIVDNLNAIQNKMYANEQLVKSLNNELIQNTNTDHTVIKNIIEENRKNVEELSKSNAEKNKELYCLDVLGALYSDDGIKKYIISSYIPFINKNIKEVLERFSFPYEIRFDDSFEAHGYEYGQEIPLGTLSAGEHKRVDISIVCVLLKLIKQQYPQLNFLFLDETLSSLDGQTADNVIRYLKEMSNELNMNIVIVSHTQINSEFIDEVISVSKIGGFSDFSIDKLKVQSSK